MMPITLNFYELRRLITATCYLSVAIALLLATLQFYFVNQAVQPYLMLAVKALPTSVTLSLLMLGIFSKRTWKSGRLSKLMGRPSVHGIWYGHLQTTWKDEKGKTPAAIPIVFVIRQSYFFLSIQSFTASQPSQSTIEVLGVDEKTSDTRLAYVYEMRRLAYGENKITTGFGNLILQDSGKVLAGDYWTNSPTQGQLKLSFITDRCDGLNSFESTMRLVSSERSDLVPSPAPE